MTDFRVVSVRALLFVVFLTIVPILEVACQMAPVQDDPVLAPEAAVVPVIDGIGNDSCWSNVPWQPIEQVWIPYGTKVDSSDYWGHYKVVWSSKTNLLYFLIEVNDNVFVDGFVPDTTSEIYNFDIAEVFIDEDKSGGLHVFDATGPDARQLGTNAENAFSYHIYAPFPKKGECTRQCYAGDIAGTSWNDVQRVNYASHLPEYAMRTEGTRVIREFSLIVYDDTYREDRKEESRSKLYAGKIMGLSVAVCDNDRPDIEPKAREKFFGSVYVPVEAYNEHWRNADYFGTVKLVGAPTGIH